MNKQDQCCSNCRYVWEESYEGYFLVCKAPVSQGVVSQGDVCWYWVGDEKEEA